MKLTDIKLSGKRWLILIAVVLVVVILAAFVFNRGDSVQYFTAPVERGDVRQVVEATGTINAVTSVQVGSQVSGTIASLFADFNSRVKKGQVIAKLDPSIYEGTLLQAEADLQNARASVASAKANAVKAHATAQQAQTQYERSKQLAAQGVISEQQLEVDQASAETAVAAEQAADADINQAQAQVAQKQAAVKVAQTNVKYTIITSPIDGTVVSRNVDVGQTVAASLQAPTLFVIAQDLTKMQVYAKTDESDVGQIRAGQRVTFKVDAFPQDQFDGQVSAVRMDATTVQNVVTYDTIVDFDNPELKLFPGMTAYVTIPVASAHGVLKIANSALRYKPDLAANEIQKLYAQYGIQSGAAAGHGNRAPGGNGNAGAASGNSPAGSSGTQAQASGSGGNKAGAGGNGGQPHGQSKSAQANDVAVVWELRPDKSLEPVQIQTGITDHTSTVVAQVLHGDLQENAQLITGASSKSKSSGGTSSPLGGTPRPGGR
ncbi:MAG TPA: efflux RND transporter periplasmic adaptor subunit [Terriglobales bacterium]|nr:efflux RND transporter periplasmic adaptor subunit [Terriglobales bacterium]